MAIVCIAMRRAVRRWRSLARSRTFDPGAPCLFSAVVSMTCPANKYLL